VGSSVDTRTTVLAEATPIGPFMEDINEQRN
jgi:hypothetical protein